MGDFMSVWIVLGAILSQLGEFNVMLASSARAVWAMAQVGAPARPPPPFPTHSPRPSRGTACPAVCCGGCTDVVVCCVGARAGEGVVMFSVCSCILFCVDE